MEKQKKDEEYLISKTNEAISELVYDKVHLIKAYNYYSGIRDQMQFKHIEENYGLGNPTSITFTPLIRKHIDVLVGEFLTLPIQPYISCKDQGTMSNIFREKQIFLSQKLANVARPKLDNLIISLLKGDGKNKIDDRQFSLELKQIEEDVDNNFISNYEIAAQNIIQYVLQDRKIDYKNKLRQLILDLFISGEVYYTVEPTSGNNNLDIKVLNPFNTFPDRNPNSPYIKDAYRIVYREFLSKSEILIKYGKYLSEEDKESLDDAKINLTNNSNVMILSATGTRVGCFNDGSLEPGLESGLDYSPVYGNNRPAKDIDLYTVYTVEWIDYEEDGDQVRECLYRTVRIGQDIVIPFGEVKDAIRSIDSPNECHLSINGMHYSNRTGKPYSLMLSTADLQDKYDILNFYKESIIANSGTIGDWIDVTHLPAFLGDSPEERLIKWQAYKKTGIALLDSSQDGMPLNTTFSGYDDTVKLQAIQAIDLAIADIEETARQITGVFRERLGGIQQRDAVANVEVGMQASFVITKQYYHTMDLIEKEILIDCLNLARKVFKKGIKGTLILGNNRREIFSALPEHFTLTDFDIHIADSYEAVQEKELLKQLTIELSKSSQVDPELIVNVTSSKSISEMKTTIQKQIERKKKENDQIQQLVQQLEQTKQEAIQMQKELQKAQQQIQKFDQAKIQLEKDKLAQELQIEMAKIKSNEEIVKQKLEQEKKRVELEALQIYDNNPRNDEIKDR